MTPGVKWIATPNPLEAQPTTLEQSVFLNGFQSVLGARRRVAASGWNPAGRALVNTDQEDSNCFSHRRSNSSINSPRLRATSSKGAFSAELRPKTIESFVAKRSPWMRAASRIRRFVRFRRARLPIDLLVVTPTCPVPGSIYKVT